MDLAVPLRGRCDVEPPRPLPGLEEAEPLALEPHPPATLASDDGQLDLAALERLERIAGCPAPAPRRPAAIAPAGEPPHPAMHEQMRLLVAVEHRRHAPANLDGVTRLGGAAERDLGERVSTPGGPRPVDRDVSRRSEQGPAHAQPGPRPAAVASARTGVVGRGWR